MRTTLLSSIFSSPVRFSFSIAFWVLASLFGLSTGQPAQATEPSDRPLDWQYDSESSALELQLSAGIKPRYFLLPNPLRLVVDIPNTALNTAPVEQALAGNVSRLRISEFQPGVTRVVMELAPHSVLQDQQVALKDMGNGQWQIRPLLEPSSAIARSPEPSWSTQLPPSPVETQLNSSAGQVLLEPVASLDNSDNAIELPVVAAKRASQPPVPFLVKFGEPLPGISFEFPAAYVAPAALPDGSSRTSPRTSPER